jgi:alpha-ketoglutarate-dependent 2,4-dichlorophenoxyacetate dioxygenase
VTFDIRPIQPSFAGEVLDLDLRDPLSDDDIAAIHAGMNKYAVMVIHGQHQLSNDDQVAFTKQLGPREVNIRTNVIAVKDRRLDDDFADVSNLDQNNKIWAKDSRRRIFEFANRLWHSDGISRVIPTHYSVLYGHTVVPVGGDTEYVDMRQAYDALDAETKAEVEDLICEHSIMYSRQQLGFGGWTEAEKEDYKPVRQRLVRRLPATGRKSLFMSSHIGGIVGWPRPEAMAYIRDLMEYATQRQFVYAHKWMRGDLIIWDNRVTMHRGRRYDDLKYVRDLRRTTTMCDAPTVEQQAA